MLGDFCVSFLACCLSCFHEFYGIFFSLFSFLLCWPSPVLVPRGVAVFEGLYRDAMQTVAGWALFFRRRWCAPNDRAHYIVRIQSFFGHNLNPSWFGQMIFLSIVWLSTSNKRIILNLLANNLHASCLSLIDNWF